MDVNYSITILRFAQLTFGKHFVIFRSGLDPCLTPFPYQKAAEPHRYYMKGFLEVNNSIRDYQPTRVSFTMKESELVHSFSSQRVSLYFIYFLHISKIRGFKDSNHLAPPGIYTSQQGEKTYFKAFMVHSRENSS